MWSPDVLAGYEKSSIQSVTLIRRIAQPERPRAVVLQVHGYNDYFFQTHVADAFAAAGYAFYAVDLRRSGRSLRTGDKPHHIRSIAELVEDLAVAAAAVVPDAQAESGVSELPLVVHAHSTGALAAAVWASDSPDPALAAVVLNSPFFGLMLTPWQRLTLFAAPVLSLLRDSAVVASVPSPYTVALTREGGGDWDFDPEWKKPGGEPATAGWINATRGAQRRVARGLDIPVPVLVGRSDSCGPDRVTNPLHQDQDVVVDVNVIAAYAPRLGADVEELVIDRGIHDLSLSGEAQRTAYLEGVMSWLDDALANPPTRKPKA